MHSEAGTPLAEAWSHSLAYIPGGFLPIARGPPRTPKTLGKQRALDGIPARSLFQTFPAPSAIRPVNGTDEIKEDYSMSDLLSETATAPAWWSRRVSAMAALPCEGCKLTKRWKLWDPKK